LKKMRQTWSYAENRAWYDEYRMLRARVRRRVRERMKKKVNTMMTMLEGLRIKDPKTFWQKLKNVSNWKKTDNTFPNIVIDMNGELVIDEEGKMNVWMQAWRSL
jgi:hypothetical protein